MGLRAAAARRRALVARHDVERALLWSRPDLARTALERAIRATPEALWCREELMLLHKLTHDWSALATSSEAVLVLLRTLPAPTKPLDADTENQRDTESSEPDLPGAVPTEPNSDPLEADPRRSEIATAAALAGLEGLIGPLSEPASEPDTPSEERTQAWGSDAAWNLGIAASILGDHVRAAAAWREYGFDVVETPEPSVELGVGALRLNPPPLTPFSPPVRPLTTPRVAFAELALARERLGLPELDRAALPVLETRDAPELVWVRRIDPARALVVSVPHPASGHRCGDMVVHDGTPRGFISLDATVVRPVFPELVRLVPGADPTFVLRVIAPQPADIEVLAALAADVGASVEDWSSSLVSASGQLDAPQEDPLDASELTAEDDTEWAPERTLGVSARVSELPVVLKLWVDFNPARRVIDLVCADLEDLELPCSEPEIPEES